MPSKRISGTNRIASHLDLSYVLKNELKTTPEKVA